MSRKGDLNKLIKALGAQGWRVEKRTKHYLAFPPDKSQSPVRIVVTESSSRARRNELAKLRQRGYRD